MAEATTTVVDPPRLSASLDPLETYLPADTPSPDCEARVQITRYDWTGTHHPTLASIFRHSGWRPIRNRVYDALKRTDQTFSRLLNFANCGTIINVARSDQDPAKYKLTGSYCHDRWCTPCAIERSRLVAHNILQLAAKQRLRFATLTLLASAQPLELRIADLRASFSRLRRTSLWKRRVKAGVACLEVKRSERSDAWHVHYHLLLQGSYIPQDQLSATWHEITGDSRIVDIRLASDRRKVAQYICKYVSKPLDTSFALDDKHLDEAIRSLKGVRLVDTFGQWRGKPLSKPTDDGTWTELGTLDSFLIRARHGDVAAQAVLIKLNVKGLDAALLAADLIDHPTSPRPPPPETVQPLLFADRPTCW